LVSVAPEGRSWFFPESIIALGVLAWIAPRIVVASAAFGELTGTVLSYHDRGPDSGI
jgi:hypothetical protein